VGAGDLLVGAVDQGGADPGRPVAQAAVVALAAEAAVVALAAEAAVVALAAEALAAEALVAWAWEAPWVASTLTLVALEVAGAVERPRARVPRLVALLALAPEVGRLSKLPAYC